MLQCRVPYLLYENVCERATRCCCGVIWFYFICFFCACLLVMLLFLLSVWCILDFSKVCCAPLMISTINFASKNATVFIAWLGEWCAFSPLSIHYNHPLVTDSHRQRNKSREKKARKQTINGKFAQIYYFTRPRAAYTHSMCLLFWTICAPASAFEFERAFNVINRFDFIVRSFVRYAVERQLRLYSLMLKSIVCFE